MKSTNHSLMSAGQNYTVASLVSQIRVSEGRIVQDSTTVAGDGKPAKWTKI